MTITRYASSSCRLAAGILLAFAVGLIPLAAQQRQTLGRIEFVGLKRLTHDQVVNMSGLKVGQVIDAGILDAAAAELLKSGLFRRLSYGVHTVANQAVVTFQVEESAVSLPVVFENFVWFSDDEIVEAIRKDLAFFNGTSPASGETPDKIAAALQRLLNEKHIAGRVDYLPNISRDKQELLFIVKGARVPVCSLHFPGAAAISEADLIKASQTLFKTDYSEKDTATLPLNLLPLYRRLGHLRAEFQPPSVTLQTGAQCPGGVNITIPVQEGVSYRWARSIWDGNDKLTVDDLATALGMNPGDLADGNKIDNGLKSVDKAYRHRGFLTAKIQSTPEYDDAASLVTYRFQINEGPRYVMGDLIISGLTPADVTELKSKWTLSNNAPFDESYIDQFRQGPLSDFVRAIRQKSRTGRGANVEIEQRPNAQKNTVDVVIAFK
jgi:outer membrane protein assembly factor BamA